MVCYTQWIYHKINIISEEQGIKKRIFLDNGITLNAKHFQNGSKFRAFIRPTRVPQPGVNTGYFLKFR